VNKLIGFILSATLVVSVAACGGGEEKTVEEPVLQAEAEQQPTAIPAPTDIPATLDEIIEAEDVGIEEAALSVPAADKPTQVETAKEIGQDDNVEDTATTADNNQRVSESESTETWVEKDEETETVLSESQDVDQTVEDVTSTTVEAVTFTAETGLGDFSTYKMSFATEFDGTRDGQPTQGNLGGLLEITKNPAAQHWQINMGGNAFSNLSLLGGGMEMYDVDNTIYIQNPGDGSWIGMPAMLVQSMLPSEMYNPEDNIDLPATAILQPGEESVNGVLTQRYTFGKNDLSGDISKLDEVEGTVWVAVDGNYVVKYEAVVTGEFDNLTAGDMTVLDEGTINMMYEVTDVDGDFTISPPAGAKAIDLTSLLFN
jgi:hypothetical protein